MKGPLVIIGCGGFGREVHDVLDAVNAVRPTWDLLGYVDDQPDPVNQQLVADRGSSVLGGVEWFGQARASTRFVIGIGHVGVRQRIDTRLVSAGFEAATLVHPSVTCGYDVGLGDGTVVCAGVRISNHVRLGRHVHLNPNATVGHDCVLEDYVSVNPAAALSGWVQVRTGGMLGSHAVVLQKVVIGARSTVGAGACVVRDVPDDTVVKGVPAR